MVVLRKIQKLHAERGTIVLQVSNLGAAGDQIAGAGQSETKTQNAANRKTIGSLNQGTPLTQVPESSWGSCKDAILAEPDLGVKCGSGIFPPFVHVGLWLRSAPFEAAILAVIGHAATEKIPGRRTSSIESARAQLMTGRVGAMTVVRVT